MKYCPGGDLHTLFCLILFLSFFSFYFSISLFALFLSVPLSFYWLLLSLVLSLSLRVSSVPLGSLPPAPSSPTPFCMTLSLPPLLRLLSLWLSLSPLPLNACSPPSSPTTFFMALSLPLPSKCFLFSLFSHYFLYGSLSPPSLFSHYFLYGSLSPPSSPTPFFMALSLPPSSPTTFFMALSLPPLLRRLSLWLSLPPSSPTPFFMALSLIL